MSVSLTFLVWLVASHLERGRHMSAQGVVASTGRERERVSCGRKHQEIWGLCPLFMWWVRSMSADCLLMEMNASGSVQYMGLFCVVVDGSEPDGPQWLVP